MIDPFAGAGEPVTLWQSADRKYPSITARCDYVEPKFTVVVRHDSGAQKTASFQCTYRPLFGMDVADQSESFELAAKLADLIAKELHL